MALTARENQMSRLSANTAALFLIIMWASHGLSAPQQATNVFEINAMLLPGLGCDDDRDNDSDGLTDQDDPDCSGGGAEARPDPWDDAYRWWVKIDTTTWHVELIGPTYIYVYDDDGYIVDWVDITVNNMFGDADGESGDAYAITGYDSDGDTVLGGLDVEEFTTAADWLWGYEEDGSFDNFDDGIAFRLNLTDLLLNPVDKYLHPEFQPDYHYYAYPLRYNGDTVLVNSDGDLLNIDTGELALGGDRTDGDNLHSDVFCDTSDEEYDGGQHGWHISDTLAFVDDGDERLVWNAESGCYDEEETSSTEIMDGCGAAVATTTTGEANRFYGVSGAYCEQFDEYQADSGSASTGLIVEYEVTDGEFSAVIDHELTFDPLILNWFVEDGKDWNEGGMHGLHRVGNTIYASFGRTEMGRCGSEDDFDCDGVDNDDDDLPLDIAASVDTDGDGWPDSFNDSACDDGNPCDENDITSTGVTGLDAFPNDPGEWLDTDLDGVGDNADCYPLDPTQTACPVPTSPSYMLLLLALLMTTLVGWAGVRARS
jgi:hypothetical protein